MLAVAGGCVTRAPGRTVRRANVCGPAMVVVPDAMMSVRVSWDRSSAAIVVSAVTTSPATTVTVAEEMPELPAASKAFACRMKLDPSERPAGTV